jgi:lipoprotein-anchoring transpeptidase ErfK/SrfK
MDARVPSRNFAGKILIARAATGFSLVVVALAGLRGEALAQYSQYYPPGPGPYTAAPPSGYRQPPPDADDPPPGYGRPPGGAYDSRSPSGIQSEALPPPGGYPQGGGYQQGGAYYPQGGPYQDGSPPPPGRGYSYGNWEPVRPPPGSQYGPGDRMLSPGPGAEEYATRPPMEITPPPGSIPAPGAYPPPPGYAPPAAAGSPPGAGGYAAFGPDYQPESGQPKELPSQFRRQMVDYPTPEPAGTIIIDTPHTYLYLVLGGGKAMRYGVGVGREGFTWAGREKISRMSEWPDWHPPKEMIERQPYLPRFMAGGESNPLGARALYLGASLYRIHGTNQPSTIGSFVSSGCIRLTNGDIEDLYSRVTVGTKVVVLPGGSGRRPDTTASAR